ncbi:MAG: thioredoxin family protein [Chthoniobacterales bacterium]
MKKITLLLAVLTSAVFAQAAPEIGKPAPDFTLKDETGADRSLGDYKGKTVVLEWFNYGCPFVKKHYDSQTMQKLQKAATDDGVVWLSVVSSAPGHQGSLTTEEAAAKKKELGMSSTAVLLDADGKVGHLYDARTTPDMFVINGKGELVYSGAIDDQPSPDPSTLEGATSYVKDALAAVKAGKPVTPAETKSYGCAVKY